MKMKEESEKVGLKLNIQKTKIMAFSPITSWQIDGEQWKQWQTLFWQGSKITADGDCSHEIKRCLILRRKVMTNINSIFKSRDITLPTNVCLVKAVVFPVVMYGCESWTVKKAERRRIDAFELWRWRRLLSVPWTAKRSNQSILKEISPGCSLEGLMLRLKPQYFGHLMQRVDSLEKTLMLGGIGVRRRRGRQRMRWLHGITNSGSSLRFTSIESVMPSSHLILCRPLLLLTPIPPSIRVFSNELTLRMRWPKYWSFSFSIIPSKEIPGLISFRMDWLDLLAVEGTLRSLAVQKHQLFNAQLSSQSNSYIHTRLLEKP